VTGSSCPHSRRPRRQFSVALRHARQSPFPRSRCLTAVLARRPTSHSQPARGSVDTTPRIRARRYGQPEKHAREVKCRQHADADQSRRPPGRPVLCRTLASTLLSIRQFGTLEVLDAVVRSAATTNASVVGATTSIRIPRPGIAP
jgi:hypothetical protein